MSLFSTAPQTGSTSASATLTEDSFYGIFVIRPLATRAKNDIYLIMGGGKVAEIIEEVNTEIHYTAFNGIKVILKPENSTVEIILENPFFFF